MPQKQKTGTMMQTSNSKNRIKALLQACLSKPSSLCKSRRETVIDVAIEQGFRKDEASELSQRILTLWSAVDVVLDQYVEKCIRIN